MDYFEKAQIGGYQIEMPFPQLFYPEMNSSLSSYIQTASPSMVNSQFYEGASKPHMDNPHGVHRRPQYVANSAFAYRSMERQNRLGREMQARNGLYFPGDVYRKPRKTEREYPDFGDAGSQSDVLKSYWQ